MKKNFRPITIFSHLIVILGLRFWNTSHALVKPLKKLSAIVLAIILLSGCLPLGPQGDGRGVTGMIQMAVGLSGQSLQTMTADSSVDLSSQVTGNDTQLNIVWQNNSTFPVTISQISVQATNADQLEQQLAIGTIIQPGQQLSFTLQMIVTDNGNTGSASISVTFSGGGTTLQTGFGMAFSVSQTSPALAPQDISVSYTTPYVGQIQMQPQPTDSSGYVFAITQQPTTGTVVLNDAATGTFTFTPNSNVTSSQDIFLFTVAIPGQSFSDSGAVQMMYQGQPPATDPTPVMLAALASDFHFQGKSNILVTLPPLPSGKIVILSLPKSGTLTQIQYSAGQQNQTPLSNQLPLSFPGNAPLLLNYIPNSGTLNDSFTYQLTAPDSVDPSQTDTSRVATVSFMVLVPGTQFQVPSSSQFILQENQSATVKLAGSTTDGSAFQFVLVQAPPPSYVTTSSIGTDGTVTLTAAPGFTGEAVLIYQLQSVNPKNYISAQVQVTIVVPHY